MYLYNVTRDTQTDRISDTMMNRSQTPNTADVAFLRRREHIIIKEREGWQIIGGEEKFPSDIPPLLPRFLDPFPLPPSPHVVYRDRAVALSPVQVH